MLPLAEELVGWLYEDDIIKRGYLIENDFPSLLCNEDTHIEVIKSRCKLLYAYLNKITLNGKFQAVSPVHLYKHHVQMRYNSGNAGIDKSIELGLRVDRTSLLTFDTNYVFSMIDRVLINTWRADMVNMSMA